MAGADLTSVDAALKETWTENRLAEQIYQGNPFLERIRRVSSTQVGQQAVTPIHTGRNWGFTPLPAGGGTLNAAGQQELKQATWQYSHQHTQVKIQGSAIDGTRGDALSVAEVVDLEVTGALDDLQRNLTRELFMDGDALISKCGTTSATTPVVLDVAQGFNMLERGWVAIGSKIQIGTTGSEELQTSGIAAGGVFVVAVTESATAPTLAVSATAGGSAANVTTSASHFVSLAKSRSGTTSFEMNGLGSILSTSTTLGGVAPASVPAWVAANVDTTTQALTLNLMYTNNRKVAQKTGKASTYVLTGLKQQQAFYNLVQAQVRFAGDSALGAGNVDGVSFNGMTVFAQPDCKNEDMFFLTIEDLLILTAGDPYWQNKITGGNILSWIQNEDSYGAKITVRLNLGCRRRNSHAALRGLS